MSEISTMEMLRAIINGDIPVTAGKIVGNSVGRNSFEVQEYQSNVEYSDPALAEHLRLAFEEETETFETEQIHVTVPASGGNVQRNIAVNRVISIPDRWYAVEKVEATHTHTGTVDVRTYYVSLPNSRSVRVQASIGRNPLFPTGGAIEEDITFQLTGKVRKAYLWPKE